MKISSLRVRSSLALLVGSALVQALGCSSTPIGSDGGADAAAGQGTAGDHGSAGNGSAGSTAGSGHAGATAGTGGGAGTGAAGGGGHAGTTGDTSCADLVSRYTDAFAAAQTCTVGATGQCQQQVSGQLSTCYDGCMSFVTDASALNDLKAQWLAAGCANKGPVACPAIACVQPTTVTCVASDGGGARCKSSYSGLPN